MKPPLSGNTPYFLDAATIGGTYTIAGNGYGSLTITGGLLDVTQLGVYMVDPAINVKDPNNTSGGGGASGCRSRSLNVAGSGRFGTSNEHDELGLYRAITSSVCRISSPVRVSFAA